MKSVAGNPGLISSCRWTAAGLGIAAVWLLAPELVQAAVPLGEIGQNVAENSKGVAKGISLAGFATGLAMGGLGLRGHVQSLLLFNPVHIHLKYIVITE